MDFLSETLEQKGYLLERRRDFHSHPELGFKEVRTAGIISGELQSLGIEVTSGVAKTGVVGLLEGDAPGPVVMVRFDMDALPVQEENQVDYASTQPGVMHACGHDGHMAIGLTTARLLAARRNQLHGAVKFVFQPAEEGLGGAGQMIKAGVLQDPTPDLCLALHLWNERPVGWLGIIPGPMMASSDTFSVKINGKGGHGALPDQSIDPILAAAQIITALQSIVSRNLSPLESAVVSVCSVQAGEAYNVIPAAALLKGTVRTFLPEVREKVFKRVHEIVQGVAAALDCSAEIKYSRMTSAVSNDPEVTARVLAVARQFFPEANIETNYRTMVSEDMAMFMDKVPGCFILVGSNNSEKGLNFSHHHPRFDFDEDCLPVGAALIAAVVMDSLKE